MKQPVYMIVGVPGSGKTWTTNQVRHNFTFVHHDGYIGHINQPEAYVDAIKEAAEGAMKPLLIEAPFSISAIKEPLEQDGFKVIPVVIVEEPDTISSRYEFRERKPIPKGHLSRMKTYEARAKQFGWFHGTTNEVLAHLKGI